MGPDCHLSAPPWWKRFRPASASLPCRSLTDSSAMGEPGGRFLQRQQSQVPLLLAGPEEGSDEPAAVGGARRPVRRPGCSRDPVLVRAVLLHHHELAKLGGDLVEGPCEPIGECVSFELYGAECSAPMASPSQARRSPCSLRRAAMWKLPNNRRTALQALGP